MSLIGSSVERHHPSPTLAIVELPSAPRATCRERFRPRLGSTGGLNVSSSCRSGRLPRAGFGFGFGRGRSPAAAQAQVESAVDAVVRLSLVTRAKSQSQRRVAGANKVRRGSSRARDRATQHACTRYPIRVRSPPRSFDSLHRSRVTGASLPTESFSLRVPTTHRRFNPHISRATALTQNSRADAGPLFRRLDPRHPPTPGGLRIRRLSSLIIYLQLPRSAARGSSSGSGSARSRSPTVIRW
jgi:hypothetical protein